MTLSDLWPGTVNGFIVCISKLQSITTAAHCIEMTQHIVILSSAYSSHIILVFQCIIFAKFRRGQPRLGAPNTGLVYKFRDFRSIFGYYVGNVRRRGRGHYWTVIGNHNHAICDIFDNVERPLKVISFSIMLLLRAQLTGVLFAIAKFLVTFFKALLV